MHNIIYLYATRLLLFPPVISALCEAGLSPVAIATSSSCFIQYSTRWSTNFSEVTAKLSDARIVDMTGSYACCSHIQS